MKLEELALKEYPHEWAQGIDLNERARNGFIAGFKASEQLVVDYLKNYRRAYAEEFCPPRKLEEFDPMVRTVVAFHMGRFLIDNMLKDVPALAESEDK